MTAPGPSPLDTDPGRRRAMVRVSSPGRLTWACPHCDHHDLPDPTARLAFILSRARYHLRWVHGYMVIPAWTPPGARRVSALELEHRTVVPRRHTRPEYVPVTPGRALADILAA